MNMIPDFEAKAFFGRRDGRSWRRRSLLLIPIAVVGIVGFKIADHGDPAVAAAPPPNVSVAVPLSRDVTEWDDYIGRFVPSETVEVRPRVSGQVMARHFRDGDIVQKGQLLFTIDQRPFLAAQAEARASVASAQSAVTLARADLGRVDRLTGDDAVSGGEIDALRAKLQSAQAAFAGAQARLRQRALEVEWTQVRAPVAGRISDRRVDVGNLVAGGEANTGSLLTTINAQDPIYFSFDASEALFLKTKRARENGEPATAVEIRLQDETGYKWQGKLDFTDNGLNPSSGTIRGRATIANPKNFLTPGMFGNMRLAAGGHARVLLIPDTSIQTDQARKTVLVVGADGTVVTKQVTVGALVDGLRIIRTGLSSSDQVVIAGMQSATPGSKVTATRGKVMPEAAPLSPNSSIPVAAQASFAT
ncbi:RND family efflux transporter, MFP subunit [Sphingobium sp. AP50]|uniref:efflux RND transporter periplasmic adaptor subunit n=1 Tax=Sphingobium sp. AP50 TaxID=1884369 RepID=UPI0008AFCAE6|nr:efflux RND transporter periplasmic adaptor subunit [Sphingobium sp. AP50]SEJ81869.1 RND family efflux transporter, MFP subunit [Sphingobium sp. AP50]